MKWPESLTVDLLSCMQPEERSELMMALAALNEGKEIELAKLKGSVAIVCQLALRDKEAENQKHAKRAAAGRKGGLAKAMKNPPKNPPVIEQQQFYIEPPTKKRKVFVPPTVEEVRTYIEEMGYHFDPDAFVDHYSGNGWKQTGGNPIKDWKASARTWERREKERRRSNAKQMPPAATPFGGNTRKDPFQQLKEKMRQEGTLGND